MFALWCDWPDLSPMSATNVGFKLDSWCDVCGFKLDLWCDLCSLYGVIGQIYGVIDESMVPSHKCRKRVAGL